MLIPNPSLLFHPRCVLLFLKFSKPPLRLSQLWHTSNSFSWTCKKSYLVFVNCRRCIFGYDPLGRVWLFELTSKKASRSRLFRAKYAPPIRVNGFRSAKASHLSPSVLQLIFPRTSDRGLKILAHFTLEELVRNHPDGLSRASDAHLNSNTSRIDSITTRVKTRRALTCRGVRVRDGTHINPSEMTNGVQ